MNKNKNLKMLLITSKDIIEDNINKDVIKTYVKLLNNFKKYNLKGLNAFKDASLSSGNMRLDLTIIAMAERAQDFFLAKEVVSVFKESPKQIIVGSVTDIKESNADYGHYVNIMEEKVKVAFDKVRTIYIETKKEQNER